MEKRRNVVPHVSLDLRIDLSQSFGFGAVSYLLFDAGMALESGFCVGAHAQKASLHSRVKIRIRVRCLIAL